MFAQQTLSEDVYLVLFCVTQVIMIEKTKISECMPARQNIVKACMPAGKKTDQGMRSARNGINAEIFTGFYFIGL